MLFPFPSPEFLLFLLLVRCQIPFLFLLFSSQFCLIRLPNLVLSRPSSGKRFVFILSRVACGNSILIAKLTRACVLNARKRHPYLLVSSIVSLGRISFFGDVTPTGSFKEDGH